ncbi:S-adenosyl-L-methionine-dependent methyltransferase [Aulographum hederae CBS 113979]|uniref:S-adenosyl-L-methionine-dependent methyltransferase n=1 Tax=Aulographum hederae CBS 113979 TaxID=1176131 RepID=A0A6G1GYM4_9PEZI|nr:S-adenosyl-L-methionine-dependent methyltransferase [Aulographum hederae CBS 113979]
MSASTHPQHVWIQKMYDPRSDKYNDSWHPSFAKLMVEKVSPKHGDHLLDLACGTGLVTFPAVDAVGPSGSVTGVDISSGMLAQARKKLEEEGEKYNNVRLFQHDITDLAGLSEIEAGKFDVITCASAFVLLENPEEALREWSKYLKPGGRMIIDVTHPDSLITGAILEHVGKTMGIYIPYFRVWSSSPDALPRMMRSVGLEVVRTDDVQQWGGDTFVPVEEGEEQFNKAIEGTTFEGFRRDAETTATAKWLFLNEWKKRAQDGKVRDKDMVFVTIARKPDSTSTDQGEAKPPLTGGCRCGNVRYTVSVLPESYCNCHCFTCRRLSGAPYLPFAQFSASDVTWISPPESLTSMNIAEVATRTFCNKCGSPVGMTYVSNKRDISLTMGSFDDGCLDSVEDLRGSHIFLEEKADWFKLDKNDGLGRYTLFPTTQESNWYDSD